MFIYMIIIIIIMVICSIMFSIHATQARTCAITAAATTSTSTAAIAIFSSRIINATTVKTTIRAEYKIKTSTFKIGLLLMIWIMAAFFENFFIHISGYVWRLSSF